MRLESGLLASERLARRRFRRSRARGREERTDPPVHLHSGHGRLGSTRRDEEAVAADRRGGGGMNDRRPGRDRAADRLLMQREVAPSPNRERGKPMSRLVATAALFSSLVMSGCQPEAAPPSDAEPERGPRSQPGTSMGLYSPDQHPLYDGRFIVSGSRVYQVGGLMDVAPWDHMGDDASNVRPVPGTIEIDVNELDNTGSFRAELELPDGLCRGNGEIRGVLPLPGWRNRGMALRARRFNVRRRELAEEHSLHRWLGLGRRNAQW